MIKHARIAYKSVIQSNHPLLIHWLTQDRTLPRNQILIALLADISEGIEDPLTKTRIAYCLEGFTDDTTITLIRRKPP